MSRFEDEAAELVRKRRREKKQRYRAKRASAHMAGNGPQQIQIWISDPLSWRAIHGVDARASLVAITEAEVDKQCREYRRGQVQLAWDRVGDPDYPLEEYTGPQRSGAAPNDMTDEQAELANEVSSSNEFVGRGSNGRFYAYEAIEREGGDSIGQPERAQPYEHAEEGQQGRVKTSHDSERDK